ARAQDGSGGSTSGPAASAPAASTATAIVKDQYDVTMTVNDPSFYKPSSGFSLGGGGKGSKLKELHVWNGAHEIAVPLERIVKIEVIGTADQDLVQVRLTFAGGRILEGKCERDLELRGRVEFGQYQIRFERLKSVVMRS
ncbi:MAG TPA: hypothetical protein VHF22_15585, partial [Planctomycetota bacterium]|nr:hypothetical protein [Planctomycetota bacterium]